MEHDCVYHANCLELLPTFPPNYVDLVVTDVPYGITYESSWSTKFKRIAGDTDVSFAPALFRELNRVTKDDTALFTYTGLDTMPLLIWEIQKYWQLHNVIVVPRTHKGGAGSKVAMFAPQNEFILFAAKGKFKFQPTRIRKRQDGQWKYRLPDYWYWCRAGVASARREHPTQKDESALSVAISVASRPDDLVLDPMCGVGSTLCAAKKLHRHFIGIDVDEHYANVARMRVKEVLL